MASLLEQFRKKCGIGEYPADYNPKIHGPYYPNRYYGKRKIYKFSKLIFLLSRSLAIFIKMFNVNGFRYIIFKTFQIFLCY